MRTDGELARQAIGLGLAVSGMAHTLLIVSTAGPVPKPPRHTPSRIEISLEENELNELERPDVEPPVSAETAPASRLPLPPRRAIKASQPRASYAPTGSAHAASTGHGPVVAASPTVISQLPKPQELNLMPNASALATTACELFDDSTATECGTPNRVSSARATETTLNESLNASANRPAYRNRREPPNLVPAADGGYDYTSRGHDQFYLLFKAHIAKDGAVQFADGANLQTAPIPIAGVFDIDRALNADEAHAAEKRWFLEATAALRNRLADTARALENRRARRMLENALDRIRASSNSPKAKRAALAELWSSCEPSERRTVEAWVRQHMLQVSELEFP